jgi:hypothetical protein
MPGFWYYDNRVHRYTKIHRADCGYCNAGEGFQARRQDVAGAWHGAFGSFAQAHAAASRTGHPVSSCKTCAPSR